MVNNRPPHWQLCLTSKLAKVCLLSNALINFAIKNRSRSFHTNIYTQAIIFLF